MTARRIGIFIPAILQRCNDMQLLHLLIQTKPTASERKTLIMDFYHVGHLSLTETSLLLETYELESA